MWRGSEPHWQRMCLMCFGGLPVNLGMDHKAQFGPNLVGAETFTVWGTHGTLAQGLSCLRQNTELHIQPCLTTLSLREDQIPNATVSMRERPLIQERIDSLQCDLIGPAQLMRLHATRNAKDPTQLGERA